MEGKFGPGPEEQGTQPTNVEQKHRPHIIEAISLERQERDNVSTYYATTAQGLEYPIVSFENNPAEILSYVNEPDEKRVNPLQIEVWRTEPGAMEYHGRIIGAVQEGIETT